MLPKTNQLPHRYCLWVVWYIIILRNHKILWVYVKLKFQQAVNSFVWKFHQLPGNVQSTSAWRINFWHATSSMGSGGSSRCNTSAKKCSAVKFVKPWMLNYFSESRGPSYTLIPTWTQDDPWSTVEASPAGHTHGKVAQRSSKDQVEWLHLRSCLVLSWCGANRNIWNCCWPWGISSPPRVAAPASLPKEKAGVKMN